MRRKFMKSQKVQKDHLLRAKKLHREMLGYWRKKERELNEISNFINQTKRNLNLKLNLKGEKKRNAKSIFNKKDQNS